MIVYASLREAIHGTATRSTKPLREIAPLLDWSPFELSMRITLGGDSARPFPMDEEHLLRLMQVTNDYSILATLADRCGYELQPKKDRLGAVLAGIQEQLKQTQDQVRQLSLELGETKGKGR